MMGEMDIERTVLIDPYSLPFLPSFRAVRAEERRKEQIELVS